MSWLDDIIASHGGLKPTSAYRSTRGAYGRDHTRGNIIQGFSRLMEISGDVQMVNVAWDTVRSGGDGLLDKMMMWPEKERSVKMLP